MGETNIHKGHREKVREKYVKSGASSFLPHELLELLLFYSVPYCDVNPTAHRLMDRFGSLSGVLSASEEELCSVPGMGAHSAKLIVAVREAGRLILDSPPPKASEDSRSLAKRASLLFASAKEDCTVAFFLDNSYRLIGEERVFVGHLASAGFHEKAIVGPALRARASSVVLASCHAGRCSAPEESEIIASDRFREKLQLAGLRLIEHFIISGPYLRALSDYYPAEFRELKKRDPFFANTGEGRDAP